MYTRSRIVAAGLSLFIVVALSACGAAPQRLAAPTGAAPQESAAKQLPAATAAPAATSAPAPTAAPDAVTAGNIPNASPNRQTRMIIKNGEMTLLVSDTDRALEKVTDAAVNSGGYIVSSRTTFEGGYKDARITMGVPVEQFEAVQRQLRALAVQVLSDTSTGQDVSDEYVDLQSRLNNLQATAARIREFLKDAKTVEEALKVNDQLSQVEDEIEKIKGRMQFLTDRSAFSTIVVDLQQVRPTPTPTPTATPTPTPTPQVWVPGKTAENAADALGGLLRFSADALIWIGIVAVPCLLPIAVVIALIVVLRRRSRNRKAAQTKAPPPADAGGPAA